MNRKVVVNGPVPGRVRSLVAVVVATVTMAAFAFASVAAASAAPQYPLPP
jgi:hypothetical protein